MERYNYIFDELLTKNHVDTDLPIIEAIVTQDSKHVLVIVSEKDEHFELREYNVSEQQLVFCKEYDGTYLRMNNIEQNKEGTVFAIAYQDNGAFFVNVIDNQGKDISNLDVTSHFKIDASSKPVTGFMEPLITCCFTSDPN